MAHWLYPANTKFYDVIGAFAQKQVCWPINSKVEVGDTVFFYLAAPHKRVAYVAEVVDTELSSAEVRKRTRRFMNEPEDPDGSKAFMKLAVRERLKEDEALAFAALKKNGLKGMLMGPRKLDNAPALLKHLLRATK